MLHAVMRQPEKRVGTSDATSSTSALPSEEIPQLPSSSHQDVRQVNFSLWPVRTIKVNDLFYADNTSIYRYCADMLLQCTVVCIYG